MTPLVALALPLLLLLVMAGVFALSTRLWGAEAGYLLGFGFYWLFWCLLVPRALLGKAEFVTILRDRALVIKSLPHDWLFPRMKVVVHHGGAGTTAAGLRAGIPNMIVPFLVVVK